MGSTTRRLRSAVKVQTTAPRPPIKKPDRATKKAFAAEGMKATNDGKFLPHDRMDRGS